MSFPLSWIAFVFPSFWMLGNSKHFQVLRFLTHTFRICFLSFPSADLYCLTELDRGIYTDCFGGPMVPFLGYMNRVLSGMFASLLVRSGVPLPSYLRLWTGGGCWEPSFLPLAAGRLLFCTSLALKTVMVWLCFPWSQPCCFFWHWDLFGQ